MAEFFDKVGAAMANMADKNKKMRSVSSMNAQIKAAEKKIDEQFRQLGAAYYNQCGKNPEENLASYCSAIEAEYNNIVALRTSINRAKGIVVCEKCSTEVALGTNFCSFCGAPLPKEQPVVEENLVETTEGNDTEENVDTPVAEEEQTNADSSEPPVEEADIQDVVQAEVVEQETEEQESSTEDTKAEVMKEEPVEEAVSADAEEPVDSAVSEEGVPLGEPCPFCGMALRPNALFCIECGNKVK